MNRVIKNASWLVAGNVIKSILGLFISIISVRYLGPSNYGLINYAASLAAVFVPVVKLGFNNVMVAEIIQNKDKEGEVLGTIIGFTFFSALFSYLGIICFCYIANPKEQLTLLVCSLYSLILFADSLSMVMYWFQAKLLSKYVSITTVLVYILISIYKIILLVTNKNVEWFAIASTFETGIIAAVLLILYLKLSECKISFNFKLGLKMFERSKYYIVATLMADLLFNMDRIMVKKIMGSEANGYYGAALTIVMMTYFVFGAITESFNPQILEYKNNNQRENYESGLIKLYSITFYLSLLQALVFVVLAKPIVLLLYGSGYFESIAILKILATSMIFNYLGPCRNIWLLAETKHKCLPVINGISAILNFILNYVLIRKFNIIGAAYATVLTYMFSNVLIGFIYKPIKQNNKLLLKSLNPKVFVNTIVFVFNAIINKKSNFDKIN